eukprot:s3772_g5.t1
MAFDDFDYEENPVEDASMSRVSYVAEPPTDPSRIRALQQATQEEKLMQTAPTAPAPGPAAQPTLSKPTLEKLGSRTAPIDRGIPFVDLPRALNPDAEPGALHEGMRPGGKRHEERGGTAAFSTVAMAKLSASGTGRKVLALTALLFAPLCFTAGPASRGGRTARAASAEAADGPSEEAIKTRSIFMSLDSDEFGIDMDEVEKSGIPTDETEPDDLQQVGDFVSGPFILPFVTAIVAAFTYYAFFTKEAENAFYYSAVNQVAAVKSDEPGFDFRALKPDVVEDPFGASFRR